MSIQFNKNAISLMKASYKRILGLSSTEIESVEHQESMLSALETVWQYAGNFENETDKLAEKRRSLTSPGKGNVTDLATHFKKLYPDKFKKLTNWDIIYTIYIRMNSSEQEEVDEPVRNEVEETTAEQPQVAKDDSDTKNMTEITVKENEKENETMKNIDEERKNGGDINVDALRKKAAQTGTSASNAKVNTNVQEASRQSVQEQSQSRLANTEGTVMTKIVLSTRPQEQRLEKGLDTKGHIPEASFEKIFNKFVENTGYNAETGEFTKIASGESENAKAMLAALQAAKADPDYEFAINPSKSTGTVKGMQLQKADGSTGYEPKEAIVDYLINNTLGFFGASVPNVAVRVQMAKTVKKAVNGSGKPSDKVVDFNTITKTSQVASYQISNKAEMLKSEATVAYWKETKAEIKEQSGCKSALSVKCIKTDANGNQRTYTYRLPLFARMHETAVTDKELEKVFGLPETLGASWDITKEADRKKATDELTDLIAVMASVQINSADNPLVADIRNRAAATEQADDEKQAEDFQ